MTSYSILGLCGSLRAKSFNLIALKTAGKQMPALVVVEAPAGVGLRYLAGRHPAGTQWGKNSWRVSLPPKGKHVF